MTEYEIIRAATAVLQKHVGKAGVMMKLEFALYAALEVEMTPEKRLERYQFELYIEQAGDIASERCKAYRERNRNQETK